MNLKINMDTGQQFILYITIITLIGISEISIGFIRVYIILGTSKFDTIFVTHRYRPIFKNLVLVFNLFVSVKFLNQLIFE